ncbi:MAG: hypothetical protein MJZ51_06950 [Bacteroidales bacterium]|nr:hypothetical protein [Bacteroidales bacterium]
MQNYEIIFNWRGLSVTKYAYLVLFQEGISVAGGGVAGENDAAHEGYIEKKDASVRIVFAGEKSWSG